MSDRAAEFTDSIPTFYDQGLGQIFFAEFADDIARRVPATAPMRVLEIAAGTGIVTRRIARFVAARGAFDSYGSQSANA
jgi:ubiquinone/menaquinone biosynthesis C-methylase UbiE